MRNLYREDVGLADINGCGPVDYGDESIDLSVSDFVFLVHIGYAIFSPIAEGREDSSED